MRLVQRSSNRPPAGPKHLISPKVCGNEKMWCEWCEKDICDNVGYEEDVMESDGYSTFLERLAYKYDQNLKAEVPSNDKELTLKRYVQKVRFWHYKHYAKLYGLPWGGGNYSVLLRCFEAKIKMTFRQPAKDFAQCLKEPFLYLISDVATTYNPIGVPSRTVLDKRQEEA